MGIKKVLRQGRERIVVRKRWPDGDLPPRVVPPSKLELERLGPVTYLEFQGCREEKRGGGRIRTDE